MTTSVNEGYILEEEAHGTPYWEGETLVCEDCGAAIDSAYGVPEVQQ